jgi:hypothetical protein
MKKHIHEKLQHLSDISIESLILEYQEGEKVIALLERYQINARPSELVGLFTPQYIDGKYCPHCNLCMFVPFQSRSNPYPPDARCTCLHYDSPDCNCTGCQYQREAQNIRETKNKISALQSSLYIESTKPEKTPRELSFKEAVFLLTFFFLSNSEDTRIIAALHESRGILSPTSELNMLIIDCLIEANLIAPSSESSLESFEFEESTPTKYFKDRVSWIVRIGETEKEVSDYILTLLAIAKSGNWPTNWYQDAEELWKLLSLHECLEILVYYSSKHHIEAPTGEKTRLTLEHLISVLPISKLQYIIYKCVKDSTAMMVKQNMSRKHAANSIIGGCNRYVSLAIANGWQISSFKRDFNFPRSALSHTLHDIFFQHAQPDDIICHPISPEYVERPTSLASANHHIQLTKENCLSLKIEPDFSWIPPKLITDTTFEKIENLDEIAFKIYKGQFSAFEWILIAYIKDINEPIISRTVMYEDLLPIFLDITIDQDLLHESLPKEEMQEHLRLTKEIIVNAKKYLKITFG